MSHANQSQSTSISEFRKVLSASKHIVAIAGAGLSAASGIPTFRGSGGLWRKHNAISLATPEAFAASPSRVWQFYHYRRETARRAQPNAAHTTLARFTIEAIREKVAPGSTFTLITQNVDGLSRISLDAVTQDPANTMDNDGSHPPLLEMHGRVFDVACTSKACSHVSFDRSSPLVPAFRGTEDDVVGGPDEKDIAEKDLPRCAKCGALARPGVVWFGEIPRHLQEIDQVVDEADLCLVVGTSSTVYPAAGYASVIQDNGGKIAVFNLERSSGDEEADFLFLGPCEDTLPTALALQNSESSA